MSSESDETKDDETTTHANGEEGDVDEDELAAASGAEDDDEDDDGDFEEEESDEVRVLTSGEEESQPALEEPRNRAERRIRAKQERRGQLEKQRKELEADQAAANRRVKLPPKTVSGKSGSEDVPPWARGSVEWMTKNAKGLATGIVVVLAVAGGAVFWQWRHDNQFAKAASSYNDALQISGAQIRAADAPPDPPNSPPRRGPTFPDTTARAQAALRAFRDVESHHANTPIAPLARLSEAATLYDLARYAEAKPIYEALLHADVAGQDARVLEGLGFTLEALNDNAGALTRYQELGRIQDGAYRDLASFHQARIEQKLGHTDRARDLLHGVIERLRRTSTDEEFGTGGSVLEGSRSLLRDIAPEDPLAQAEANAPNSPEALQRMIQQLGGRARVIQPGRAGGAAPGGEGGR